MAGYGSEGAAFSVVLFEHIGLIGSIGLACSLELGDSEEAQAAIAANVSAVADSLCALIENHEASASPRLDDHIIDISLALMFLMLAERHEQAKSWVAEIARRLDYCFKAKSRFPVSTDSLEDLVDLEVNPKDAKLAESLMRTSWSLATVSAWCVILDLDEHYAMLSCGAAESYNDVCAQLWHPTRDWHTHWYFSRSLDLGETEAPYTLPPAIEEMRQRMEDFIGLEDYDWVSSSPSRAAGIWAVDFIASRHFRTPVPASAWYRLRNPAPQQPRNVG
ncbi:MAG: hypothetical protein DI599_21725 [Pseudomonas kuykendallii]|uniref:Uncharacterized protein n=2 Tax=Pseudomonas kuykendallii TaxID=1007099 RepID=A0A2W5CRV5_9PSED|nr:MAG: hypothetical protein DI599_21725 [Pseudomonas kuykendallii]